MINTASKINTDTIMIIGDSRLDRRFFCHGLADRQTLLAGLSAGSGEIPRSRRSSVDHDHLPGDHDQHRAAQEMIL